MAPRLGVPLRPCDTPAEFAAAVERGLVRRRPRVTWLETAIRRDVELALDEISLLTRVYERVSYAPTLPALALMRQVWQEGHHLRRRLWRLRALSALPSRKL